MKLKEKWLLAYSDMSRHKIPGNKFISFLKKWSVPGCKYMILWRFADRGGFWKIIMRHYSIKYGYQIPIGTRIGKGFYIGHFGAIVINHDVSIGEHCNIAQNVTIGMENRGKRKGTPKIGNRVWIGAGSVIVGKITIGDDVLIAPNAYVNCDVPSHSVVLGNPCIIRHKENATENYIN